MLESFGIKPGDVFTWDSCPFRERHSEPPKKRWFILLGHLVIEKNAFVITATTRLEHYTSSGQRENNVYFKVLAGTGGFLKDSVVDLSQDFQEVPLYGFEKDKDKILKAGTLNQASIDKLLDCFNKARFISKVIKKRICECLKESGFSTSRYKNKC